MKKRNKKLLGLFLLGLFGFVIFSAVVNAAETQWEKFEAWTKQVWETYKSGTKGDVVGDVFIKILFGIIITLMVFSILDTVHLFENKPVLFIISVVTGILGTYYMSTQQIGSLSDIYTAFGGTLVTVLPFIVLSAFTFRAINDGDVQLLILQHVAWGIFSAFLAYSIISNVSNDPLVVMWVVFIISLILTFANSAVLNLFAKRLLSARIIVAAKNIGDMEAGATLLERLGQKASSRSAGRLNP